MDRDCPFLVCFGTPAAAVHHPEKSGFDPGHPFITKAAATQVLVLYREIGDGWVIGLVYHNAFSCLIPDNLFAVTGQAFLCLCI